MFERVAPLIVLVLEKIPLNLTHVRVVRGVGEQVDAEHVTNHVVQVVEVFSVVDGVLRNHGVELDGPEGVGVNLACHVLTSEWVVQSYGGVFRVDDFFAIGDVVDGLLVALPCKAHGSGLVMHDLGDVEHDVLAVNPRAYACLHEGGHTERSVPSLLESLAEFLEQHLRVLGFEVALGDVIPHLHHADANLRSQTTNRIPPHGAERVSRELVVVQGSCLVGQTLRAWLREDGVTAIGKGSAEAFSGEHEVWVLDGVHSVVCLLAELPTTKIQSAIPYFQIFFLTFCLSVS